MQPLLATTYGPGPLVMFGVLALPVLLSVIVGIRTGFSGGHRGVRLRKACPRAVANSFLLSFPTAFLLQLFSNLAPYSSGITGQDILEAGMGSLLLSLIESALVSFTCAPIAAFLAYNFGARKRVNEHLLRQSFPSHTPDQPPP